MSFTLARTPRLGARAVSARLGRGPRVRLRARLGIGLDRTLRRALDVGAAAALLGGMSPVLLVLAAMSWRRAGRVLDGVPTIGRDRRPFERLRFAADLPGRSLPGLVNVLRGDLALAGPRPLAPAEAPAVPIHARERFEVRPGLVSLHDVRRRTGVAHAVEAETDREYVYGQTLAADLGLLARCVPAVLLGGSSAQPAPPRFRLLGVGIDNTTMTGATDWIVSRAASGPAAQVAFVNPACLNAAREDPAYRDALAGCERVYADGIGIHLACRLLGLRLAENVNGTDLFPRLCEALASSGRSVYLLGARPGVAAAAAEAMARRVPRLIIAGTRHGYFPPEDTDAVIDAINRSGADVLLVAFGAPAQELWLARHRARLAPSIRIGVGGLFDFYSGRIPRAPRWLQELGLEWVWRLVQEPRRMWRRYLVGNPLFLWRVMRQRIAGGE